MKKYFVFDVESIDLHGEGFAVSAIVTDNKGNIEDKFELLSTEGSEKVSIWVKDNVLPHLTEMPKCETLKELRTNFYNFYLKYKDSCDIWSDCNFPVETNFLSAVVRDDIESRQWNMPYPLKDISTIVDINIDRSINCDIENLRKHHPTDDCIASLTLLLKYERINQKTKR